MPYENVLLIDDDVEDQEIFVEALEHASAGVKCITLGNAKDALNKLSSQDLAPDLIFLDLNMPVMSGVQFLTELKKDDSLKKIPVVILSTSSDKITIEQTKKLGAMEFITKPDTFDGMVFILKSFLG